MRAVLFDLFGTVVRFRERVPTIEVAGEPWRTTMQWLEPVWVEHVPEIGFRAFLEALLETTRDIVQQRPPEFREVPSTERFTRALLRVGLDLQRATTLAPLLSERHMEHLTQETEPAPAVHETLAALRTSLRLALVSNFDHERAARSVLDRHGLTHFFDRVVISAGFGRRKPHPSIFLEACRALAIEPPQALFVGDNYEEDVRGALAVGLRPVWLCGTAPAPPTADDVLVIRSLPEVLPLALGHGRRHQ